MKIAYLQGLELQAPDNRNLRKALGTFCVLKAFDQSGFIAVGKYQAAADLLQISTRTLYSRIKLMQGAGLLTSTRAGLSLASWQKVKQQYKIEKLKFYYIKGPGRPDLVLSALFIRSRQKACELAFLRKVNKDQELVRKLEVVTGLHLTDKGFAAAVQKAQLLAAMLNKPDQLITLNANTTPGYKNLSDKLGYNSRGGFKYLKDLLAANELLTFQGRQYVVNPKTYSNVMGNVSYRRPYKQRVLQLTDAINF